MGDELMTAAVELTSITKRFGDVTAVDHVDLAIADGEFFAMLGPSGLAVGLSRYSKPSSTEAMLRMPSLSRSAL